VIIRTDVYDAWTTVAAVTNALAAGLLGGAALLGAAALRRAEEPDAARPAFGEDASSIAVGLVAAALALTVCVLTTVTQTRTPLSFGDALAGNAIEVLFVAALALTAALVSAGATVGRPTRTAIAAVMTVIAAVSLAAETYTVWYVLRGYRGSHEFVAQLPAAQRYVYVATAIAAAFLALGVLGVLWQGRERPSDPDAESLISLTKAE
jgi:hypothetical protein